MTLTLRGGRFDWKNVANELTSEDVDEYYALALLEGWAPDDAWKMVGTIAGQISNAVRLSAVPHGISFPVSDFKFPEDYLPKFGKGTDIAKKTLSVEEMEARAEARYGSK